MASGVVSTSCQASSAGILKPLALILASLPVSATCVQAQLTGSPNFRPIENSRRIVALKEHLEAGDPRAMDEFWREVARSGTPLSEPEGVRMCIWIARPPTEVQCLLVPVSHSLLFLLLGH